MYYILVLIFIIGLIFGSFASVIIHRLHSREKGILLGRSKCPKCSKELKARDLIPVLSILINKFKCRFCKKKVSPFYLFLELTMGATFVLTASLVGVYDIFQLAFFLLITFVFVVLTFYDILFQEVPDEVSLPAVVISFLYFFFYADYQLANLFVGILVPALFFGGLFFISKGRWLGGGDIRIGALMGAILAWPNILIGLFIGYFVGAVFSLLGLMTGKISRKSQIPFAPFLLIGAYIAMFWGDRILSAYLMVL